MGNKGSNEIENDAKPKVKVFLNVYDSDQQGTHTPGFGVYHTGVEVYGAEYAYARHATSSSGIYTQAPQKPPPGSGWRFYKQLEIGETTLTKGEVKQIADELGREFRGNEYHVLSKNCNHFSDAFCKRLVGKGIPGWVNRAAKVGNVLNKITGDSVMKAAESAAAAASQPTPAPPAPSELMDLTPYIDVDHIACLNQSEQHTIQALFGKGKSKGLLSKITASNSKKYLESDCDPQLLLFIPFTQAVKIKKLVIGGPVDGTMARTIRLFVNQPNMDFDSAESTPATQEVTVEIPPWPGGTPADTVCGVHVTLNYLKFQHVNHLTIFIVSNQGEAERTVVTSLEFVGVPVAGADVSKLRAVHPPGTVIESGGCGPE